MSPEAFGEGASGDQVVGKLWRIVANFTGVRVQDVLLPQVRFALNSVLEEEPSEELDLWWSVVLPDKAVVVAGGAVAMAWR